MTLQLLDLRLPKDVAQGEKASLPVSITYQPDGTSLVVSRYEDDVWDFYPYIAAPNLKPSEKRIDWRLKLPDGRRLTDSKHAELLECKRPADPSVN